MNLLYDSDTFTVTHMLANMQSPSEGEVRIGGPSDTVLSPETSERFPAGIPTLARHGFEIVDKRSGKEVYLDGSWADLFQQHIVAWQVNTPTQDEVEETLAQYAELAQNPVVMH